MLQPYLFPVGYAFLTFPIAALLFTLPFLIVQYRRHGYINKLRGTLLYLFLLYLMNAIYLVLLPMPSTRHNAPLPVEHLMQLIPFTFIEDIGRETSVDLSKPAQYIHFIRERAVLQVLFNILLTVPFGLFMRYYFRIRWFTCLLAAFGLSLFFEITQVTGIYGYFDHPYRLFDVDDLMLNTLGGMTGYLLAELLAAKLPRIDLLDQHLDLSAKRVSYTRRGIAFMFDSAIMLPILAVGILLGQWRLGFALAAVYAILVPYWTNGRSFGRSLVRIAIKGQGERLTLRELLIRQGLMFGFFAVNLLAIGTANGMITSMLSFPFIFGVFILNLVVALHVIRCLFNHQRRLWHESFSDTHYRIVPRTSQTTHTDSNLKE